VLRSTPVAVDARTRALEHNSWREVAKRLDCQITGLAILTGAHGKMAIGRRATSSSRDFRIPNLVRAVLARGRDAVRSGDDGCILGTAALRGRAASPARTVRGEG
jgi:hypothetical protein